MALLDIALPAMDGYELARRLREQQGEGVQLVALTAWGRENDRQRTRDAGFRVHLVKPVDVVTIDRSIRSLLVDSPST